MSALKRSRLNNRTMIWFLLISLILIFAGVAFAEQDPNPAEFKVTGFSPEGVVTFPANIKIEFSSPVIASDDVGKAAQKSALPVVFSPPITGQGVWISRSAFMYQLPDGHLQEATAFEATIPSKLKDYEGRAISGNRKFSFSTPALEFVSIKQTDYRADEFWVEYQLQFNAPVRMRNLRTALSVTDSKGSKMDINMIDSGASSQPVLRVDPGDGSPLSLKIEAGLVPEHGTLSMKNPVSMQITRDLSLKILDSHSYSDYSASVININTTSQPDADKITPFIEITPQTEFYISTYGSGISINGKFPPRDLITVKLKAGLPAVSGPGLDSDWERSFIFPDYEPSLSITSPGRLISPAGGELLIPFSSVNVKEVRVNVERVYDNNVSFITRDEWPYYLYNTAETIYNGHFDISAAPNENKVFAIDLRKILDGRKGLFMLNASGGEYWPNARRLVNVTDIAGSAKIGDKGALVWANSVKQGKPMENVSVDIYSSSNQVIASGVTDSQGVYLSKPEGGWDSNLAPALVILRRDDDTSILRLEGNIWRTGDADYLGVPYKHGQYQGFIYLPREIFRPGETVPLRILVRKPDLTPDTPFPVQLKVYTSAGREWVTESAMLSDMGMASAEVLIDGAAPTGIWRAEARIPGENSAIAACHFMVEDFAPPKIEVEVTSSQDELHYDSEPEIEISAKYLFGALGEGLDYEVERNIIPREYRNENWPDYIFSDFRVNFETAAEIQANGILDEFGRAAVNLPPIEQTAKSILDAVYKVGVKEEDGRWVYKSVTIPYFPRETLLGIKTPNGDLKINDKIPLAFAALDTKGNSLEPENAKLSIKRVQTRSITTMLDGRRQTEWKTEYIPLENFESMPVKFENGHGKAEVSFKTSGSYVIVLESDGAAADAAAVQVYVYSPGWYYGDEEQATLSESLSVKLDKDIYKPGEKAVATVTSLFDGTTLLSVETDEILYYAASKEEKNTAEFSFTVTEEMAPNAWVTAHHIKAANEEDNWSAHRVFGAAPIKIYCGDKQLNVKIISPEKIKPDAKNDFSVEINDSEGKGIKSEVTLMVVDEAVLGLTAFKTPDFYGEYIRKRALTLFAYDVYDELIPLYLRTPEVLAPGGGDDGAYASMMKASLSPVRADRFKILTVVKGIETDENGRAGISLDIPEFSGKARIMVHAASKRAFGAGEEEKIIAREVVSDISLPRAVAPGDEFKSTVQLFNRTDSEIDVNLSISIDGPLSVISASDEPIDKSGNGTKLLEKKIKIESGEKPYLLPLILKAEKESNVTTVSVKTEYAGDSQILKTEMAVRPPYPRVSVTGALSIEAGETKVIDMPEEWFPGTKKAIVSISSLPSVSLNDMAKFLRDYPYWCLEQTVSRGWALLYLPDMAAKTDQRLATAEQYAYEMRDIIRKLQSMQYYNGGFSFWPSGGNLNWASVYATHFLIECERRGIDVPRETINSALGYLRYLVSETPYAVDKNIYAWELTVRAYACYALSLKGEAPLAWMAYLRDNISSMPEDGRLFLAAAYAAAKDIPAARNMLGSEATPLFGFEDKEGIYFNSDTRTRAINLLARTEIDPFSQDSAAAAKNLLDSIHSSEWFTTQEAGWSLHALSDFYSFHKNEGDALLEVADSDGRSILKQHGETSSTELSDEDSHLSISNQGKGIGYASWTSGGIPIDAPAPEDKGMNVTVRYYDADGFTLNEFAPAAVGQKVFGEITLTPFSRGLNNVVISLPFAGGFEVENASLIDASPMNYEYQDSYVSSTRTEMRDDRLLLFVDHISQTYKWRFSLRAITAGNFILPPVAAEGMYAPGIRSVSETSRITVK